MIHGSVTLDEVFSAAWARAASLVPETSGYLALAVGDATSRLPFAVDGRLVMLTTEGSVSITKRGEMLTPAQAAKGLRAMLARLLAVSTGTAMPSLSAAARPREESDRGVDTVIGEIEAALIPVNRSAARRALARLVRETIKAREAGKLRKPSTRPPAEAPRPAVAAAAPVVALAAPPPPVAAPPVERPVVAAQPVMLSVPALVTVPVLTPAPEPVVAAPPVTRAATPAPPVVAAPVGRAATPAPPVVAAPVVRTATPAPPVVAVPIVVVAAAEPTVVARQPEPAFATPGPVATQATMPPQHEDLREAVDELPLLVEAHRDPTPTWLGMAAVEVIEPEVHTLLEVVTEEALLAPEPSALPASAVPLAPEPSAPPAIAAMLDPEPSALPVIAMALDPEPWAQPPIAMTLAPELVVEDPELTALPESTVLGQPTEDPALAFEMVRRVERPIEALTPPFPFEIAPPPRGLPVARAAEPVAPVEPAPAPELPPVLAPARVLKPTRADDLLAHFGATCVDEDGMREAAACLRRIAGLEPTPPPARVELHVTARPAPPPAEAVFSTEWATPEAPQARRRRATSGVGMSLLIGAIVVGLAAGGAVIRFRPDLLEALVHATTTALPVAPARLARDVSPPAPPPAALPTPTPTPASAPTIEPASVVTPVYGERLGGTRAERGSGQRAR